MDLSPREKKPCVIGIDFDDTLVPTAYLYQLANWECGRIIAEAFAPFPIMAIKIIRTEEELDIVHAQRYGFSTHRFQYSWMKAYRALAKELEVEESPSVLRALRRAAARFKEGPFTPFPGVVDTLHALREDGHRLDMITAGPRSLQARKIRESGLAPLFDRINIVDMDKRPVLKALQERADGRSVVMVGDSKKSDIAPAIELGIVPVWLARGVQWSFAHTDVDHDKFHAIHHFRDLPALLAAL